MTLLVVIISACSAPSGLSDNKAKNIIAENAPSQWQASKVQLTTESTVADGWLQSFNDNALEQMIAHALAHNFQLNADRFEVELARERLKVNAATDFPELSLSLNNSRRKQVTASTASYQSSADISVDLRY